MRRDEGLKWGQPVTKRREIVRCCRIPPWVLLLWNPEACGFGGLAMRRFRSMP